MMRARRRSRDCALRPFWRANANGILGGMTLAGRLSIHGENRELDGNNGSGSYAIVSFDGQGKVASKRQARLR